MAAASAGKVHDSGLRKPWGAITAFLLPALTVYVAFTAYPAFREPLGFLLFAGSDYADGWAGFVDGAIESGLRAAPCSAPQSTCSHCRP